MKKSVFKSSVAIALLFNLTACGQKPHQSELSRLTTAIVTNDSDIANESILACVAANADIASKLTCLPSIKNVQEVFANVPAGYRRFDMTIAQPVDHLYPEGRKFSQKLILWHRGESEPMILHASGYKIFNEQLYLLADRWKTNQIQVSHRYFTGSEPTQGELDWSKMTVAQSAADFHRIVVSLKQVYTKNWVNNGGSKGGMTSVFFRRYYPNDLSGTVADVAPLSFAREDSRYIDFVDHVGGDDMAECRTKLRDLQRVFLTRRTEFLTRMPANTTYDYLGGPDVAFEHTIISVPYAFHQYHNMRPTDAVSCGTLPPADASAEILWNWLQKTNAVSGDEQTKIFVPYYYQANTELGGSADRLDLIADLLQHPYSALMYGPKNTPQIYADDVMRDMEHWLKTESQGIMYVYGESDPWTAGMFPFRPEADSFRFTVPKGNHSSKFTDLPTDTKAQFVDTLSRWLGKQMPVEFMAPAYTPKEDPQIRL